MKRIFLFALFLVTACAPTPTPAPTLTATLVPSPTFTSTPAPTATITPSLTPSLPADVEAVLADEPGYQVFENDKIVSADGEILFRWVPEADRYDPSIEWQRYITFTTTENEKIEMPRFETFDDALKYISERAFWRTGNWKSQLDFWTSFDNQKAIEFFPSIKKIPNRTPIKSLFSPIDSEEFVLLSLSKIGANSFLIFEPEKDSFAIVYIDQPAESFSGSVPTPQP